MTERDKKWQKNNKDRKKELDRKYYLNNKSYYNKVRREYSAKNKDKVYIWNKVNYELRKKGIKLAECVVCSSKENLIKHHEDYSKPFDVIVLCKGCHNRLHHSKNIRPQTKTSPSSRETEGTCSGDACESEGNKTADIPIRKSGKGFTSLKWEAKSGGIRPYLRKGCGKKIGSVCMFHKPAYCGQEYVIDKETNYCCQGHMCKECREKSK